MGQWGTVWLQPHCSCKVGQGPPLFLPPLSTSGLLLASQSPVSPWGPGVAASTMRSQEKALPGPQGFFLTLCGLAVLLGPS